MSMCPECQRKVPPQRNRCLYCGAELDQTGEADTGVSAADHSPSPSMRRPGTASASRKTEHPAVAHLAGLPEPLRKKALEALNEKGSNVKIDTQTVVAETPDAVTGSLMASVTLEESLAVLARVKGQFDSDQIDYDIYRQMVVETIKGYTGDMDPKTQLAFLANDIRESDLFTYLDDDIHKALLGYALAAASGTDKP